MSKLKLALLDMAATTVNDTIDGRPLVLQTFADCFAAVDVGVSWDILNAQRGQDKRWVFQSLLASHGGLQGERLEATTERLLQQFTAQLLQNVSRLEAMPGAIDVLHFLKQHGLFVALGSGFPPDVTQAIVEHLRWCEEGLVDYVTCGELAGAGRPAPHMLHRTLQAAGLLSTKVAIDQPIAGVDYQSVLKVGDTVQDVAEGRYVGAVTIAVASGTQSAAILQEAGALAVLPSIAALPVYLRTQGLL